MASCFTLLDCAAMNKHMHHTTMCEFVGWLLAAHPKHKIDGSTMQQINN
jgi:hypothetical protein